MSACSLTLSLFLSLTLSIPPPLRHSQSLDTDVEWRLCAARLQAAAIVARYNPPPPDPTPPDKPGALELSQSFSRNKLQ